MIGVIKMIGPVRERGDGDSLNAGRVGHRITSEQTVKMLHKID